MKHEDVILSYIEYLASLIKNTDETVVIQSDDRILEGFHYEKEVEQFLKTAVEQDLFEVYYQPIYWNKEDPGSVKQTETSQHGHDPARCIYRNCREAGNDRAGGTSSVPKSVPFREGT